MEFYRYPEVWCNCHVASFFETSALKKVRIFYLLSPQKHYNATDTKGPNQNFFFLNVLNKIYLLIAFFAHSVCECLTFFYINGIFKTRNSKSSLEACFLYYEL